MPVCEASTCPLRKLPEPRAPSRAISLQHEQLIERSVVERAGERLLIVVGAVGVIDRDGDVALAGQILGQVAEQEAVAGIPVGDDHQWKRRGAADRRGVANGPTVKRGLDRRIARDDAIRAAARRAGCQRRRVPDFQRQRSIVTSHRSGRHGVHDVHAVPINRGDRADPNRVAAIRRQFGSRRRHHVDAVLLREQLDAQGSEREKGDGNQPMAHGGIMPEDSSGAPRSIAPTE